MYRFEISSIFDNVEELEFEISIFLEKTKGRTKKMVLQ